jgi:uncharacterized protein YkwD
MVVARIALVALLISLLLQVLILSWRPHSSSSENWAQGTSATFQPVAGDFRNEIKDAAQIAFLELRPNATYLPVLSTWLDNYALGLLGKGAVTNADLIHRPELQEFRLLDLRLSVVSVHQTRNALQQDPTTIGRAIVSREQDSDVGTGTHFGIGVAVATNGLQTILLLASATPAVRLYTIRETPTGVTTRPGDRTAVVHVTSSQAVGRIADLLATVEAEILAIANDYRVANSLPRLLPDQALDGAARLHSIDMATRHYYSHTNLNGLGPHERIQQTAGWSALRASAENISWYGGANAYLNQHPSRLARSMMDDWIHSEGHRLNLLSEQVTTLGVGVAYDARNDRIYGTQKFASRRP